MSLKTTALFFWIFILIIPQAWSAPAVIKKLEKTPLPRIQIPEIQKKTLDNGMRLLLLHDDEIPVVRGFIYVRTGSIYEPSDALGLAEVTGALLRSGGTQKTPWARFDERLAALGAEIGSSIKRDYGIVFFKCLSEDLPEVLGMVFEMLRQPAFAPEKLNLEKRQMIEAIKGQNDKPGDIAMREFRKLIYGASSIYARTPTLQSVKDITREEVKAFYSEFFHPDRMIFGIAGDFQKTSLVKNIKKLSQGWPKAKHALPEIPSLEKTWETGLYLAPKKTDQVSLILGHYGERRFNPDKFALLLLNDILGGDVMSSRLGRRIRSTLGLAYGIYSNFGFQTDYGLFTIFVQTKAANANRVLAEIRKILKGVVAGKTLTEAELEEHKQSVVNSLYAQYEPRFNFVRDEARFEYYGYPPNYLQIFRENIQKVTLADIRRVAKKYLRPDALKVLVVGEKGPAGVEILKDYDKL